ncbi:MAG: hypothetical protein IJ409_09795 [Lachnospiraceae bacterium]|nr:hypothetical protein [Lachnospiraceae bacterium]MBQ8598068.1 hypothetical protein [Lachnospiraceae bacterium]
MPKKWTNIISLCVCLSLAGIMCGTQKVHAKESAEVQATDIYGKEYTEKEETQPAEPLELYFNEGFYKEDLEMISGFSELTYLEAVVAEEMDLGELLGRENLDLRLHFSQELLECEEESFKDSPYIVCRKFEEEVDWRLEGEAKENFLATYQRKNAGLKKVECFTIRRMNEGQNKEEYPMCDVRTYLRVTEGNRRWILETGVPDGTYLGDGRSDCFAIKDINFDGVEDVTLRTGRFGNQGIVYEFGWIWDETKQDYIYSDSYSHIGNPSVDPEQQIVRSSWRNSAVSHGWGIYEYRGGEFVLKSKMKEDMLWDDEIPEGMEVPENGEVWCWTEEIFQGGERMKENRYYAVCGANAPAAYPEAYYEFMERDSYWGYPKTENTQADAGGFLGEITMGFQNKEVFCELWLTEDFAGQATLVIRKVPGAKSENYYEVVLTDFQGKCKEHGSLTEDKTGKAVQNGKKAAEAKEACMYEAEFPVAYIYADEDKIYWMAHEEGYQEIFRQVGGFPPEDYIDVWNKKKMERGDHRGYFGYRVVCAKEEIEDNYELLQNETYAAEEGMNQDPRYHNEISAIGNRREYSLYPDKEYSGGTTERMFMIWEKGEGLTYFENWVGAYRDYVAFWT